MSTPRKIPGRVTTCGRCAAPMVWARTVATESGRGGKAMPLDPYENPDGNVAARALTSSGQLVARVLCKGETHDVTTEIRAMPHVATCTPPPLTADQPDLPGVIDLDAARRRKATSR